MMKRKCRCEHWQTCPVCYPQGFDANGKRLPIKSNPLTGDLHKQQQADEALLRQALDALTRSDYLGWQLNVPIIKALRERLAQPE